MNSTIRLALGAGRLAAAASLALLVGCASSTTHEPFAHASSCPAREVLVCAVDRPVPGVRFSASSPACQCLRGTEIF